MNVGEIVFWGWVACGTVAARFTYLTVRAWEADLARGLGTTSIPGYAWTYVPLSLIAGPAAIVATMGAFERKFWRLR